MKALALSAGVLTMGFIAESAVAAPLFRTASLVSKTTGVPDPDTSFVSFRFASADGSRVFLETTQAMTADDTDGGLKDVYMRSGGTTTLVSQPLSGADDTADVSLVLASSDGARAILRTTQKMTADDNDSNRQDLYERSGDTTTLLSAPTGISDPDTGDVNIAPFGVSADATRIYFETTQNLTAGDMDTNRKDLYVRSGGATTLVSQPASGVTDPNTGDASAGFVRPSDDGTHVFFETTQAMTGDDMDAGRKDLYERTGGDTTLVSKSASGVTDPDTGDATGVVVGSPADGTHVFFETTQKMTDDDDETDKNDVYERSGGETTLVSKPESGVVSTPADMAALNTRVSADGSRVFLLTTQQMTSNDLDSNRFDVYERSGGTTTLVSVPTGVGENDSGNMSFGGMTPDGSHVFLIGPEKLTPDDGDTLQDVYERSGGTTKLVSKPASGVPDPGTGTAIFRGNSADGSRAFFSTPEKMTADDNDTDRDDTYERTAGTTTLAIKPSGVPDPDTFSVTMVGQSADAARLYFQTTQRMSADDNDTDRQDIYVGIDAPPQTTITGGPSGTTGDPTPTFSFSSSEADSSFQCSVDGGSFTSCSSPRTLTAVSAGSHAFRVRARDPGGNLDPSPASRTFTVDTSALPDATAPGTEITKGPKKKVKTKKGKKKVRFEFSSDDPSAAFECSLDDEDFKPCTSPDKEKVKKGKHSFEVRAIDLAGNVDPTPDRFKFRVKRKR